MKRQDQHFLLSVKAHSLSLMEIFALSDDEAFDIYKKARWVETDGEAICSCCGSCAKQYFLKTRKQWRCKDCNHTFSVNLRHIICPSLYRGDCLTHQYR
jgi:hypothetical protein